MQNCMAKFPSLYSKDLGDDDELGDLLEGPEKKELATVDNVRAPQKDNN